MADIRCPMCGKSNPASLETCQYCQARLKPLVASSFPDDEDASESEREAFDDQGSELPDWLSDLRPDREDNHLEDLNGDRESIPFDWDDQSDAGAFSGGEESDDVPDWLSRLGGNDEPSPPPPLSSSLETDQKPQETPDHADVGDDLPDWLSNLGGIDDSSPVDDFEKIEPSQDEPIEGAQDTEGNEPDWLLKIRARQEEEQQPEEPFDFNVQEEEPVEPAPLIDSAEDGLPDWLSKFDDSGSESGKSAVNEEGTQDDGELAADAGDLPDWLSQFNDSGVGSGPSAGFEEVSPEDGEPAAIAEELPDWLSNLPPQDEQAPSNVHALAFDEEDDSFLFEDDEADEVEAFDDTELNTLPEWISQVSTEDAQAEEPIPEESSSNLAPAELPSWLEAMRPVETAAPKQTASEVQGTAESAGPLSGLRGVLPAEPEFAHLRRPPVYSVRLQLTDKQKSHLDLMEQLLASEDEPKPIPGRPIISSHYLLRLFVAIILFTAILIPLALDQPILPIAQPAHPSPEVVQVFNIIESVPAGAPVLLAVDYQTGLTGELETAASAVIQRLVDRGAYIVAVSTDPTGPYLTGRLFNKVGNLPDSPGAALVNLGFIPGGAAGLRSFVERPAESLPNDLAAYADSAIYPFPWTQAPLTSVSNVGDFVALLVMTDRPETAQLWIEQAQPVLAEKDKPLIMVVSAQVEPVLQPYYRAFHPQVNGMIVGLAGTAEYERLLNTSAITSVTWNAFGAGILVAAALMLVGGLISLIVAFFSQRKRNVVESAV